MDDQHNRSTTFIGADNVATQIDIELLGRQRPEIFKSRWSEVGFCASLLGLMFLGEYLVSGFHIILPSLAIELEIPKEAQTWPSSVFSLVGGACLLPFGRLSEKFGGYLVFNAGLAWFSVWTLVSGFSQNYVMLIVCRAMKGLGMSAVLPAGVMLLGKIYRPGPRKNLIFALYGSFAPVGFFCGIFIGGLSTQYLSWRWYFWIASIIMAVLIGTSLLSIPNDYNNNREIHMDWWGTATIVPGLSLITYALTDSAQAPDGWKSPQILVTFLLGILCLAAGYYVENHVASSPLLPADLFAPRYMKRLVLALWLTYGAFGLYLFYSSFYLELVLQKSPIVTAIWYIPMIVGGLLIGVVGGFTLHLLPGRALLFISGCGNLLCVLLFAILPEKPNYWAFIFPAMVCATIGIDISFTVSNVYITTALPENYQGLAGALINSLLFLGISFWLGVSDIVVHQTTHLGLKRSYQMAFWLAVGAAGVALLLYGTIKIGSAKSDLTVQEKRQMNEANSETFKNEPVASSRKDSDFRG